MAVFQDPLFAPDKFAIVSHEITGVHLKVTNLQLRAGINMLLTDDSLSDMYFDHLQVYNCHFVIVCSSITWFLEWDEVVRSNTNYNSSYKGILHDMLY